MNHSATTAPQRAPKEILTLPPLPHLRQDVPLSPRTGMPKRPWPILAALIVFQLAVAGVIVSYGWHWYRAVFPETYPTSAHLIQWVKPAPGKWLSLTLEGVIAAITALVGGICGVAGFQAWNGWRLSRWLGVGALLLTVAMTITVNWVALAAIIPASIGAVVLWLPPASRCFSQFQQHRGSTREPYRRPDHIFYGRLPRFR